jgi:hypothetical protein
MPSASYGKKAEGQASNPYVQGNPYIQKLVNQTQETFNSKDQNYYTATQTTVIGTGYSIGEVVESGYGGWTVNADSTQKITTETDWKITYTDSTSASSQQVTEADVVLQDWDNTLIGPNGQLCKNCHGPLPDQPTANIYLDKIFGSFMFQGPAASAGPWVLNVGCLQCKFNVNGD